MRRIVRRRFLFASGALLAVPRTALAQSAESRAGALRRVAILGPSTRANEEKILKPFFDGMGELGWTEGKNIAYERAYAGDDHTLLPSLAAELVKRNPEVIFAPPVAAAMSAARATRTIPVVFSLALDPVGLGLVKSLARPERNVTGVTFVNESLSPKRIQMLKEVLPKAVKIGLLFDPTDKSSQLDREAVEKARIKLGVVFIDAPIGSPQELDAALRGLLRQKPDAVLVLTGTLVFHLRERIVRSMTLAKIPVIASSSMTAEDGALFTYGSSLAERIHRAAHYVDRILRGAKPHELPVEQMSRIELVVNLKAAKTLGLKIPQSVLVRADRVIE
ncbi:MAG: ABC transporter substrate-binding protein [Betaproteobacteria bacterium]|nr:ABC transporter substrate-binding protein [Betaproteobacteria bacterium]